MAHLFSKPVTKLPPPIEDDRDIDEIEEVLDEAKEQIQKDGVIIASLEAQLLDKNNELERMRKLLESNTLFLQQTIMELIQLKAKTPEVVKPAVSPAIQAYLDKKNAKEANGKAPKLP